MTTPPFSHLVILLSALFLVSSCTTPSATSNIEPTKTETPDESPVPAIQAISSSTPTSLPTASPTNLPSGTPSDNALSPYELAAHGEHGYQPPQVGQENPYWAFRFQSSRILNFEFISDTRLQFDPHFEFFSPDARVPVVVQMTRAAENTWTGTFSTSLDPMLFSVSESVVFEADGIIWHEFITDENPGYYSHTVECGPAKWTRLP